MWHKSQVIDEMRILEDTVCRACARVSWGMGWKRDVGKAGQAGSRRRSARGHLQTLQAMASHYYWQHWQQTIGHDKQHHAHDGTNSVRLVRLGEMSSFVAGIAVSLGGVALGGRTPLRALCCIQPANVQLCLYSQI